MRFYSAARPRCEGHFRKAARLHDLGLLNEIKERRNFDERMWQVVRRPNGWQAVEIRTLFSQTPMPRNDVLQMSEADVRLFESLQTVQEVAPSPRPGARKPYATAVKRTNLLTRARVSWTRTPSTMCSERQNVII